MKINITNTISKRLYVVTGNLTTVIVMGDNDVDVTVYDNTVPPGDSHRESICVPFFDTESRRILSSADVSALCFDRDHCDRPTKSDLWKPAENPDRSSLEQLTLPLK